MTDSPSPVRASAQDTATFLAAELAAAADVDNLNKTQARFNLFKPLILDALLAAEARGRQQAEQARDEERNQHIVTKESLRMAIENVKSLQLHSAALTQALKDAVDNCPSCQGGGFLDIIVGVENHQAKTERRPCQRCAGWTKVLDVALTGAQA